MSLSDQDYSEKRDFIRMKISTSLPATLSAASGIIEGNCRNLSGGGMLVEAKESIPVGSTLEVEVSTDHGHSPTLKAKARVVRSIAGENGKYEMGLEIIEVLR